MTANERRIPMQAHSTGRAAWLAAALVAWQGTAAAQAPACHAENTVHADVVAIDMPMVFNRLGAQNVNWQMYALRHDLVVRGARAGRPLPVVGAVGDDAAEAGKLWDEMLKELAQGSKASHTSQARVTLRPDLRPRPLVLRVAAGECLQVRFTNLLTPISNPYEAHKLPLLPAGHPMDQRSDDPNMDSDNQVASRRVGFHPNGLQWVDTFAADGAALDGRHSDASHVGVNPSSLAAPGETKIYRFFAPAEGSFLVTNPGAAFGGEGTAGTSGTGLFGAVAVQPVGGRAYRGQVTEEELRLATRLLSDPALAPVLRKVQPCAQDAQRACTAEGDSPGQPIVDYEARYPGGEPWSREGKAKLPILAIHDTQDGVRRIVHGDVNAVVMGPLDDGRFPKETYPLESTGATNPSLPNRLEPFREFVSVFHDENAAAQAFPGLFEHPVLGHTLHGVRDAFMINYGSAGVGAEVVANRLGVGPMSDCVDCAFEEFFLSSFTVGDPALLVDRPANLGLEQLVPGVQKTPKGEATPDLVGVNLHGHFADGVQSQLKQLAEALDKRMPGVPLQGPKAAQTYYPHDPANVHHSYIGDFVKFRNLHTGKEQHIFHLHNHQWLFNPNDDNSNYIDAQAIGPGSGYTYEIAFGGSGNRNKSAGDAVFHCHYYPHFAQGMWYLWRIHDTFEAGSALQVSQEAPDRIHQTPYGLADGTPAKGARALPDGELVAGTPIPAVVPLPGKAMAPMPGAVQVKVNPAKSIHNARNLGSLADVVDRTRNPGYPFFIAGMEHTVGSRPTTPPLDMDRSVGGADGGVPRHAVYGYSAGSASEDSFTRLDASKKEKKAKPQYFDEAGTELEKLAMAFHEKPAHASVAVLPGGAVQAAPFETNGGKRVAGAPFFEPCMDDRRQTLTAGTEPWYFGNGREGPTSLPGGSPFNADTPRIYKGANIQLDVTINKLGDHYPQQRILALWEDVDATLATGFRQLADERRFTDRRPPEPLVLRMNTFDCARYLHTNLVPKEFEMDDYQVRTPTDVIGQHIHLPKWDLPSADGSANGWNYEDGTFSPGMVRSRIHAINEWNKTAATRVPNPYAPGQPAHDPAASVPVAATADLKPAPHYFFGRGGPFQLPAEQCAKLWESTPYAEFNNEKADRPGRPGQCDWLGARTTIQRWFSDPIVNKEHVHRGLGITFTHDHLGPSTHQQVGLYATMLTEPPASTWVHNESNELLYNRDQPALVACNDLDPNTWAPARRCDGGPTSWQAVIRSANEKEHESHREFFLQFGDFQHAYRKTEFRGLDPQGVVVPKDDPGNQQAFRKAVTPSFRKPSSPNFPDVVALPDTCPGGVNQEHAKGFDLKRRRDGGDVIESYHAAALPDRVPRPCPEIISADDIGTMVVNYRQEPVAARVLNLDGNTVDKPGSGQAEQSTGGAGDLALAFKSRVDRQIDALNLVHGDTPYAPLTHDVRPGDPFTPILRAYSGDMVRIKIQAGSHEHEHTGAINGLKWLQAGSGYGQAPHSGWRGSQNIGLSEQFTLSSRITDHWSNDLINSTDRLYAIDTSQDGLWNGVWGMVRTLERRDPAPDAKARQRDDQDQLALLPANPLPTLLYAPSAPGSTPPAGRSHVAVLGRAACPAGARVRAYHLVAGLANELLPPAANVRVPAGRGLRADGGSLVYNPHRNRITLQSFAEDELLTGTTPLHTSVLGVGPLHDPTAILIVRHADIDATTQRLKPTAPVEPVVLRAAAGECVQVRLDNRLPLARQNMPDLAGYTTLSMLMPKKDSTGESEHTSFNNNHVRPSNRIGLHPQMVLYDMQLSDASAVGFNSVSLARPGHGVLYQWYAGELAPQQAVPQCLREVEGGDFSDLAFYRRHVYRADERQLPAWLARSWKAVPGVEQRLFVRPPNQSFDVVALTRSLDVLLRGQDGAMPPADDDTTDALRLAAARASAERPGPRRIALSSQATAALQKLQPGLKASDLTVPSGAPADWQGVSATDYHRYLASFLTQLGSTLDTDVKRQEVAACLHDLQPKGVAQLAEPALRAQVAAQQRVEGGTVLAPDNVPTYPDAAAFDGLQVLRQRLGGAAGSQDLLPLRCATPLHEPILASLKSALASTSPRLTLAARNNLLAAQSAERLDALAARLALSAVFLATEVDDDADPDGGAHDYAALEARLLREQENAGRALDAATATVQRLRDAAASGQDVRQPLARAESELRVLHEGQLLRQRELQALKTWRENWRQHKPIDARTTRLLQAEPCAYADIEFGGTNLSPPDRIKQGQKAAVGALVIEPRRSLWLENVDDKAPDRQNGGRARATRATADVYHLAGDEQGKPQLHFYRDLVTVHQKGLNLRYGTRARGRPSAVGPLAAERTSDRTPFERVAPEDAHDAGQMGINYASEPLWFRFGIDPSATFGAGPSMSSESTPGSAVARKGEGFGALEHAHEAFADTCCTPPGAGAPMEPQPPPPDGSHLQVPPATPVFAVPAFAQARLRMLMPTGVGRGSTMALHGHGWLRDPYLSDPTLQHTLPDGTLGPKLHEMPLYRRPGPAVRLQGGLHLASSEPASTLRTHSQCQGRNALGMYAGAQDSISPSAHFDWLLESAGGFQGIAGDYLLRDIGGFGVTSGLWATMRVGPRAVPIGLRHGLRTACP
jgi:hypothetical protein